MSMSVLASVVILRIHEFARRPVSEQARLRIRELQRQLRAHGVQLQQQADESTTGPASFVAVDPDGNPILVDQHV